MNSTAAQPVGLAAAREGIAAVRARAWLLAVLAVLGLVVGYALSVVGEESGYRLWLSAQPLSGNKAVTEIGISTPEGPQAADFFDDRVSNGLERETKHDFGYLVDHLSLEQPPTGAPNPPIALVATGEDADAAKALLRTWLASIHEVRAARVDRALNRTERRLDRRLERAKRLGRTASATALAERLARLDALRATLTVDYAVISGPRKFDEGAALFSSVVAGGLAGLFTGIVLALAIALLDGVVRTREGIEAAAGIELLADLRPAGELPSPEHARERLRARGGGSLPSKLVLVPCGAVDLEAAATRLSGPLGGGVEVVATRPPGENGVLAEIASAPAWAVAASPGGVRRAEIAALRSELSGIGTEPAGLLVV